MNNFLSGRRIFLLITVFIFHVQVAIAQKSIAYFNTAEVWEKLHPTTFTNPLPEHTILLISNRQRVDTGVRFMEMAEAVNDQLTYFLVAEDGERWLYQPLNSISEGLKYFKNKQHWVIYNEGMGKVFTTNISRGITLSEQYNCGVIMLDYPSISAETKPIKSYRFAVKHARNMYKDFLPALDSLRLELPKKALSINLMMHSMGNYLMRKLTQKKSNHPVVDSPWLNNLIYNAACVPARAHRKWMKQGNAAENVWVHYNPDDRTLYYAEFAMFQRQLGRKPSRPLLDEAHYINFQPLVKSGHSNFLEMSGYPSVPEAVKQHYHALFHGKNPLQQLTSRYTPSSFKKIGVEFSSPETVANAK